MASSEVEFTALLASVFDNLFAASAEGPINFICMDWRHMGEVIAAARGRYADFKNL